MSEKILRSPERPNSDILIGKQREVYEDLHDFMGSGKQMFCFEGFAGSGKTFCINMFVEELIVDFGTNICIATPTHKAKVVVQQMAEFKSDNLQYSTIHSVLGLKPVVTSHGEETFVKDRNVKNRIKEFDLVIIDESSMLDDKLFSYLKEELDMNPYIKIIFVGDGKQLPPVNHASSIPMNKEKRDRFDIDHIALTQIVRQSGTNPIIEFSKQIREGVFRPKTKLNDDKHGVIVVKEKDYSKVLKHLFCSGKYDENPNYCRATAWTNRTVNHYNIQIRKMLYKEKIRNRMAELDGMASITQEKKIEKLKEEFPYYRKGKMTLPKYLVGDKVIVDKPIFTSDGSSILFQTNEELIVQDYTIEDRLGLGERYKCYIAQVRNIYSGLTEIIEICHEDDEAKLDRHMEKLKKEALRQKKGSNAARKKWIIYYDLDKRFSRLKYAPCLTTYKSQGSTYENIVIIVNDIVNNPKQREMLQHLYVGVTRASQRTFLFV